MIEFDWDQANIAHIARHNVTTREAEFVLSHFTLDIDFEDWHGEERFAEVGVTEKGRCLVIWTTWRGERLRVVTAYEATKDIVEAYLGSR